MEGKDVKRSCIDCAIKACSTGNGKYPDFCVTTSLREGMKEEAIAEYMKEENNGFMCAAAQVEYDFYGRLTRVEETIEFAKRMGYKKIGIATCVGLLAEARTFAKILRNRGFEVYGVCCKVGAVPKTTVGIPEECEKRGKNMCNPILQAKLLNEAETDLNVAIGLCVGHDSLFYKYSNAMVTTLIAKDRVLAHNPAGALYQCNAYYSRLMKEE